MLQKLTEQQCFLIMNNRFTMSIPDRQEPEPGDILVIGLTGGIGSGKTTVSKLFEKFGVPVIDTDVIAHELVEKNSPAFSKIIDAFGSSIIARDGTLDRKKLAQIVFSDSERKQILEDILHPEIRKRIKDVIQSLRTCSCPPKYVIVVIPLLFETGFTDLVHRILVVTADEQTRINRVKRRDNRNVDDIRSIINNQVSDEIRLKGADDILENNNDFRDLEHKTELLHARYLNQQVTIKRKS
jgi:dephospho-CoA kinase